VVEAQFQQIAITEAATAMTPESLAFWPMAMKIRLETMMAMISYSPHRECGAWALQACGLGGSGSGVFERNGRGRSGCHR
jgi:hypothetical protein